MKGEQEAVLYRKYRPRSFKEVLGQEQVVRALESALTSKRLSHAYLFAGPRGTGKTSVARIFAESLEVKPADLYELDAASNRGIDEVRLLREGVAAAPFQSPYKVYIIDEAHMLTREAFNALLKTLEEPPAHAVFILATTEFEKLPETIVSRCEVHIFRRQPQTVLKEMAELVAKKEGFSIEPAAAELIGFLADGSFRDAHGALQKAMGAASDRRITLAEIERVAGAPRNALVNAVIEAVEKGESEKGLSALSRAARDNADMKAFTKLLLAKLRFILILRNAPGQTAEIRSEVSEEDFAFLERIAKNKDSRITSSVLLEFLSAHDLISFAALPALPLELAVLKTSGNQHSAAGR